METGLVVPFGRYVLKERLAQGGMGEVFRAVAVGEHGFEKPVVVKRILPAHAGREDLTDLFVAEAKLMTRLAHPNIVEVLDFGRGEHRDYYLVLELVEGVDLGRLLRAVSARGEPFPIPLALFIASQVLRGLHHAHTRLADGEGGVVVHRDVSPSNVLCSAEGEVKVADFGVALVTRAGERDAGGGVAGKPGYMAPEQLDGGAVDPRADVFSAGVVLHQMLTGEIPFRGDSPDAILDATRRGARDRAAERRAEVSEAVEAVLARAMAPRPEDRFADARSMAQAIEAPRDQGQRIAGGDDLAEAVRAAQRELPAAGRKVIALTGASGVSPEEEPRELTRTGAPGSVGAFTLRFPVRADATTRQRDAEGASAPDRWSAPEPKTERISPPGPEQPLPIPGALLPVTVEGSAEPPSSTPSSPEPGTPVDPSHAARRRTARRTAVSALFAVAMLAIVAVAVRGFRPPVQAAPVATQSGGIEEGAVPRRPSAPPPVVAPPATETAPAPAVVAPPPPAPVAAAPAPRPSGHPIVPRPSATPVALAVEPPAGSAKPAASAQPVDDCAGDVAFYSDGAWVITGGPRTVQSPSPRESWQCGTYQLVARSRLDPTQVKTATVTISPNRQSRVDLR